MVIARGGIFWADLGRPKGSQPAKRRPVLIVQADSFNASRIGTVIAAAITSNERLATAPGNVALPARISKLPKDSVINVAQVITLDRSMLAEHVANAPAETMTKVDTGLRLVLAL